MRWQSFTPLNGWILVKMDSLEETTQGGIYKPDKSSHEHLLRRGTVLKVSMQIKYTSKGKPYSVDHHIRSGDRVLFSSVHGDKIYFRRFKIMFEDQELNLLKPEDILLFNKPHGAGTGIDDVRLDT